MSGIKNHNKICRRPRWDLDPKRGPDDQRGRVDWEAWMESYCYSDPASGYEETLSEVVRDLLWE